MNLRHLVTKGFDSDISIRRSIVYPGTQLQIGITHKGSSDRSPQMREEPVQFNKAMPESVNLAENLRVGKEMLLDSPLGDVVSDGKGELLPLSSLYDFKVEYGSEMSAFLPTGTTFNALVDGVATQVHLREVAREMFPLNDPRTGDRDMPPGSFYEPYVPLVMLTGCMTPQLVDGEAFFNPNGTVTVAEFLDGLNAIKHGCNANNSRRKTLDNISTEADYFNEGYNSALRGISSPFFNLYTRAELVTPITRLELAYITVICWSQFMNKYNNLYGGSFYLGVTFDWEAPNEVLSRYADGYDYKVSRISVDDELDVTSLNVKDYRSDRSMEEYRADMLRGVVPIPMPMFMSMLELGVLDLFMYEDDRLDPLKEVSRGELCYFLASAAKHFPIRYMKS